MDPYARLVAYDEGLAERLRAVVDGDGRIREQRMFGGIAFLCDGNMAFGIVGDELMVRVGKDAWAEAVAEPHAREMDLTGKPMPGMVYVAVEGIAEDDDLRTWVGRGLGFAGSLPPKAPKP
jgi:TfoX/Sxy family transcriptional regulator of competence genes